MSRESNDAFEAHAKREGFRVGTWNYIHAQRAWHAAIAYAETQAAPTRAEIVESIAKQWDGCMADMVGGEIDIGATIRHDELMLAAAKRALSREPT